MPPSPPQLRIVGVMTGTSIDAVDCALCTALPDSIHLERFWSRPLPPALRARLHAAARNQATAWECGQLHHDFGRFCAGTIDSGLKTTRIDAVGFHGQTVFHQPRPPRAATWQIGEPAWIAERLGVPVVANFRVADLAAGGQGAPLATLFHQVAFARAGAWTAVQNLGGIGNVTLLDHTRPSAPPRILAFDTGPANVLLDLAARHVSGGRLACDRDGRLARRGQVHPDLLARALRHPFFRRTPPKSTGRELFGEPFFKRLLDRWPDATRGGGPDLLATLTEFTAQSIALNYRLHLPPPPEEGGRVILAGGGASNPALVDRLRDALTRWHPRLAVIPSDDAGWPRQAIEPAAFALLAARRLWRLPGNIPDTTGARSPRLLGQIYE